LISWNIRIFELQFTEIPSINPSPSFMNLGWIIEFLCRNLVFEGKQKVTNH